MLYNLLLAHIRDVFCDKHEKTFGRFNVYQDPTGVLTELNMIDADYSPFSFNQGTEKLN